MHIIIIIIIIIVIIIITIIKLARFSVMHCCAPR